ncbi:MAG: hypothetical protein K0S91_2998 [Nitrososphaeraceae archaeon]|jgi:hypothetical protein|nr:hypothetical protein [Nitrososphaeraceae archaeon]
MTIRKTEIFWMSPCQIDKQANPHKQKYIHIHIFLHLSMQPYQ